MTIKKTAISIERPLFEEMDALAKEMEVSRSYLFKLAAREFIERNKNRKLLESINAAFKDVPDSNEEKVRALQKSRQHRLVNGQW
jgi:metal-responsive CopG/Arc/MetJ family transcriptional regulator